MYGHLVQIGTGKEPDRVLSPAVVAGDGRDEAWLRDFLLTHPVALPAADIDPAFSDPVPICRELRTGAGRIDALFANRNGALIIVECKLWRNPQARREVVAQILDYAKELAGWRYEDLQREVSSALGRPGQNALFLEVAAKNPEMVEADFVDRVSRNLASGRFLLLIVGDGIHEGTESIARYVAAHAGLHFTLGLVELVAFQSPAGSLLVQPRVLARTVNLERAVFRMEGGGQIVPSDLASEEADEALPSPGRARTFPEERKQADRRFWQEFKNALRLDDPSLPPPRTGWGRAYLDSGSAAGHITIFSMRSENRIGAFLRLRGEAGRALFRSLQQHRQEIDSEIAALLPDAAIFWDGEGENNTVGAGISRDGEWTEAQEAPNLKWLLRAANVFVNVFRPRLMRLEAADGGTAA